MQQIFSETISTVATLAAFVILFGMVEALKMLHDFRVHRQAWWRETLPSDRNSSE